MATLGSYFEFTFDATAKAIWYINAPDVPPAGMWSLMSCKPYCGPRPLIAKVTSIGGTTNVAFGTFGAVYVKRELAEAIAAKAGTGVELIPVEIAAANSSYVALNVLDEVDCIDESRSEFTKWSRGNRERPDKAGEFKSVAKLIVDPVRANGHHLFRLKGWRVALIVSSELRAVVENYGARGCAFLPVS